MFQKFIGCLSRRCLTNSSSQISSPRLFASSCLQRWPRSLPFSKVGARSLVNIAQQTDVSDDASYKLFNYTKYRFLYNEKYRLAARKTPFNINEFKALAAASVNQKQEDVVGFEKLADGDMNRVFLITMRDGFKFVGRIPYPFLEPLGLLVASEVATMDFLRLHGLPVPQVFDYSGTPNNAARTEYMFMQLVPGKSLGDMWNSDSMSQEDKIEMVKRIVELESRILGLEFPASGSLYYSKDVEGGLKVDYTNPQARDSFCVGPDTDWTLWWGKRSDLAVDCGPHLTPEAAITAGAKKEIAYLEEFGRPIQPWNREYRDFYQYEKQLPHHFRETLQEYLKIAPYLIPEGTSTRPALRHAELSLDNIMVSAELEINGVINWQHCSIRPLFVQSGIPEAFHNPEYLEADDLDDEPRLPADYHQLSAADQDHQTQTLHRRQIHHAYVAATEEMNPEHTAVMKVPANDVRRGLCLTSAGVWRGDPFPLEFSLAKMIRRWHKLTDKKTNAARAFPFHVPDAAWQQSFAMFEERHEADEAVGITCALLGLADTDGLVPPEDYDDAKRRAAGLRAAAAKAAAKQSDKASREFEEHWFFDDFDEEEYK